MHQIRPTGEDQADYLVSQGFQAGLGRAARISCILDVVAIEISLHTVSPTGRQPRSDRPNVMFLTLCEWLDLPGQEAETSRSWQHGGMSMEFHGADVSVPMARLKSEAIKSRKGF